MYMYCTILTAYITLLSKHIQTYNTCISAVLTVNGIVLLKHVIHVRVLTVNGTLLFKHVIIHVYVRY